MQSKTPLEYQLTHYIYCALGGIALIFCMPFLYGLVFSVLYPESFAALSQYTYLAELKQVAFRSLIASLLAMLLAIPTSFTLARLNNLVLKNFLLVLLLAPWLMSSMLRAFGWQLILSPNGLVSALSENIFGWRLEGLRYNYYACLLGIVSNILPISILCVYSAIPNSNTKEWLAVREMGGLLYEFIIIGICRAQPGILAGLGVCTVIAFFSSVESKFLGGPTQISFLSVLQSIELTNYKSIFAFNSIVLAGMLIFFSVGFWVSKIQLLINIRRVRCAYLPYTYRHGQFIMLTMMVIGTIFSLLIILLPVAMILIESFYILDTKGGYWGIDYYTRLLEKPFWLESVFNSIVLGGLVSFLTFALAFCLSFSVWVQQLRWPVLAFCLLLFLLPAETYSLSLIQSLKQFTSVQGGFWLILVGHCLWLMPYSVIALWIANSQISKNLLYASMEMEASSFKALFLFILKVHGSKIISIAFLTLVLSMNDSVRASYLGGHLSLIGTEIHGRLQTGLFGDDRALLALESLIVVLTILSAVLVVNILNQSRKKT